MFSSQEGPSPDRLARKGERPAKIHPGRRDFGGLMALFDLAGRVAVVTGGNGGIGLGMARGLAQAGAAVAIAGRNVKKSEAAAAELAKLGARTAVLEVRVTDETACRRT